MAGETFSSNQALGAGDTISSGSADGGAPGGPAFAGQAVLIVVGSTPITFPGDGGMLQVMLQASVDGVTWGDHHPLTPLMSVKLTGAGQVLARRPVPALGGARYIRLAYRAPSGAPAGTISASLEQQAADRFEYGRSGFQVY